VRATSEIPSVFWLLAREPHDDELPEVIAALVDMLRRAVTP
jgi:hypothetical protein